MYEISYVLQAMLCHCVLEVNQVLNVRLKNMKKNYAKLMVEKKADRSTSVGGIFE